MKLNIYKASAGSGKTYILAKNYILESFARISHSRSGSSLYEAFKDTMAFARILAVTFTNKAAGEMKARILKEFDVLANGQESSYLSDIKKLYPNLSDSQIAQRARSIRSAILHNYSDFNLRTIDSFVQRIVRSFCYDINVSSGFSTQTDETMVLNELIEILLKKSDDDPELRKMFLAMSQDNVEEGKQWDFRGEVTNLAKLIFSETFQTMEKYQSDMDDEAKAKYFKDSLALVRKIHRDFEEEMKNLSARAEQVFATCGAPVSALGQKAGWVHGFLVKNILACSPSASVLAIAEGGEWLSKKPTAIQSQVVPQLQERILPILVEAISIINHRKIDYFTAKVILKDFNAFMLLGDLARLMPEYRRDNKMMLVSDATAFLNAIVADNDAPFIYERVGNSFDHVYIDEFQDTSEFQWNNFRPLIQNSLAMGHDNMIVGDVKQAIYRFRGGDWSLLNSKVQEQIHPGYINFNTLDVNYRSRKNIVQFNDAVFQKSVPVLDSMNNDGLDFQLLSEIYSDSYQKVKPQGNPGGKVNVLFFESPKKQKDRTPDDAATDSEDDDDFNTKALSTMAQEIDSILKSGVKAKKICILVRKGYEASLCVNFLMEYQKNTPDAFQYDVVSSDSLYVKNSLTVSIVSNAMKYINNQDDILAKVEMMRAYCNISDMDIDDDDVFKAALSDEESAKILPEGFNDIKSSYSDMPLYDLCEKIISCFGLSRYTGDQEYLRTFEDYILNFTKNYSSDLNRFVHWWDESGSKSSIQPSDDQNAVNVMTVHKSKGLDFSVQFIPFCSWPMEEKNNRTAKYIWVKSPENSKFSTLPVLPVRYSKALADTHFAGYYYEEKRNLYVDSLNLLYVALTRAVDELHIYCKKPAENIDKVSDVGSLIYHAIVKDIDLNDDRIIKLSDFYDEEKSQLLIDEGHEMREGRREKEFKSFKVKPFSNAPWEDKLAVRSHSSDFFIQNSPFLQERINHGLFMHNIMAHIEYREDVPEVLQEMVFQGRITEPQRQELTKMLDEAFQIPEVSRWFSHEWKQVINERALLTTEGNIRIPDRVLVSDTETIVIDFKFGKEHEQYRDQITEYANLLKSMRNPVYPNVQAYLYFVETKKIVKVV